MKERKVIIHAVKDDKVYVITGDLLEPETWEHAELTKEVWEKNHKTDSNGVVILTLDK